MSFIFVSCAADVLFYSVYNFNILHAFISKADFKN